MSFGFFPTRIPSSTTSQTMKTMILTYAELSMENLPFGFKDRPQSSLNPALPFTLHYNARTLVHCVSRERAKAHTVARGMKNLRR